MPDDILLEAKDTWPRTSKVCCHRAEEWQTEPDLVERVPVRSCVRRGAAIDPVLDRGRENRSQLVLTLVRCRPVTTASCTTPAARRGRAQEHR